MNVHSYSGRRTWNRLQKKKQFSLVHLETKRGLLIGVIIITIQDQVVKYSVGVAVLSDDESLSRRVLLQPGVFLTSVFDICIVAEWSSHAGKKARFTLPRKKVGGKSIRNV